MIVETKRTEVTATEFKNAAGAYIEQSAKEAVVITKHGRPARVLVDIDEYERLKALDIRAEKMRRIAEEDHAENAELYQKLAR